MWIVYAVWPLASGVVLLWSVWNIIKRTGAWRWLAIAELIVHGGYRTIDLARFGYERIRRKEPLFELNIF